jgi:hypothetical protein
VVDLNGQAIGHTATRAQQLVHTKVHAVAGAASATGSAGAGWVLAHAIIVAGMALVAHLGRGYVMRCHFA